MRRYALSELLAATGLTESGLTRRAGISGSTLKLARERGFTADAADRYSTRCGLHPSVVWPSWLEDQIAAHEVECAAPDCTERFIPHGRRTRFHSTRCRKRTTARERYAADPAYRERTKARVAAFSAETREVRLRKQAAYRARNRETLRVKARRYGRAA